MHRSRIQASAVRRGVVLVAITVGCYYPSTQNDYIWDDDAYVFYNETLRSAAGLGQIWLEIGAIPQYYPLVHTTYWLEYRLWGLKPVGYHVVNVLLHAGGAVLLWRLLVRLAIPGAWFAAAIFALHTVHVESVAWITERKNVLSGVFYLGAAIAYLRFALGRGSTASRSGSIGFYALSLALFLCALMSKTVTFSLPATMLLVLWWKNGRIGVRDILLLIPFFVFGIGLSLVTLLMEKEHVGAIGAAWDHTFIERCLIAGRAIWFYAGKLVWPVDLFFFYPRWQVSDGAGWQHLFPLAVLIAIVTLIVGIRRIGRGPLAAVLFFIGTLFPALGFFDVYPMRFSYVADHFQYLASIGLIVLTAAVFWQTAQSLGRYGRASGVTIAVAVLMTLGLLTWQQQSSYSDAVTLFRDTAERNPAAWLAHRNLGRHLSYQRDAKGAILHYLQAVAINPQFSEAYDDLGVEFQTLGQLDKAIYCYRQAIRSNYRSHNAYRNWGSALQAKYRPIEAVKQYRKALQLKPDFTEARLNLAGLLSQLGQDKDAIEEYYGVLRLEPDHVVAMNNVAQLRALSADPSVRDSKEAVRLAKHAADLTQDREPRVLSALAEAYAADGQFERAVDAAKRASNLAQHAQNEKMHHEILQLLEHIRQQQ